VKTKGISEIGFEIPIKGYMEFISAPVNIKNERLNPIEYKIVSVTLELFILRIKSRRKPGTNVR